MHNVHNVHNVQNAQNVQALIEASKTIVIIPARNEAKALADLLPRIPGWVHQVIVVDNASTDETSSVAEANGAQAIREAQLGYGAACSAGLKQALAEQADFIVFMDGDASDDPAELVDLLEPLVMNEADLVIGRRKQSAGMTFPQRAGTRLVCGLLSIGFGTPVGDIGPFRAATHQLLSELPLIDRGFGWTAEMQAEAMRAHKRVREVEVSWRSGLSPSEISGNWRGVIRAARDLLRHSLREIALYRIDRYRSYAGAAAPMAAHTAPNTRNNTIANTDAALVEPNRPEVDAPNAQATLRAVDPLERSIASSRKQSFSRK